ncbi:hypothetical protein F5Y06DRAFT_308158 [Hypoxylon sp. FL0890]|nr:hypothetical protein F5Y06DRAFT_308158 [Hypoxylon sp. FL0890]
MPLEPRASQFEELPTTSSPLDPISTNSAVSLSWTSARVATVLPERTRSPNIDGNLVSEEAVVRNCIPDDRRGRSATPFRAQVKRRRSVASVPGDKLDPPNEAPHSPASRGNGHSNEREVPRGRTMKRATSYPTDIESRKRRKVNGKSRTPSKSAAEIAERIKNPLKATKGPERIVLAPLPLAGNSEQNENDGNLEYERKGAFRLKKRSERADEFRFPKPLSQPEPVWRAGDGFSSDEAKPDFMFLVTSTHKQRTPGSLPGIGKLELQVENADKENLHGSGVSKPKVQRPSKYEMKRHRGRVKDVWPTRGNFSEELEAQKQNTAVPENRKIIPSTVPPQLIPEPGARETFKYNPLPLRARNRSDFEHFGQHRRESDDPSTTSVAQPRTMQLFHIGQPEPGGGEEFEYEEEYETGDDNETVPATNYDEAPGEGEEHTTGREDTPGVCRSRESSANDSAISVPKGEKSGLQIAEQFLSDILTQGESQH